MIGDAASLAERRSGSRDLNVGKNPDSLGGCRGGGARAGTATQAHPGWSWLTEAMVSRGASP